MSREGDKRKTALERLKVLTCLFIILGILILVFAGLGTTYNNRDAGKLYYIGGFIVGPMALLTGTLTVFVLVGSMGTSVEDDQMKQIAPRISCQYSISTLMIPACFIGCVFTGLWGIGVDEENSKANKNIAIVILTAIILVFLVTFVSMCTIRSYGKYFGVVLGRRGRQTNFLSSNTSNNRGGVSRSTESSGNVVVNNSTNIFSTDANQQHVSQLEQQNILLRQQLELQQKMLSQQRQQQQQFSGGGIYPPPPPPSYSDSDPAYPPVVSFPDPSAPPPPYSKIK